MAWANTPPDDVIEVVWELTAPDPFLVVTVDYGGFALPSIGVKPGRWRVRAAVWGRAEALALEDELIERDVADYEAWETGRATLGANVVRPGEAPGPHLGPEAWALDMWLE